jgi:Family of unknown function (DUF5683)
MRRRNPQIALLLSAILPGLGQLYNRDISKGITLLAISLLLGWMTRDALFLDVLVKTELPADSGRLIVISLLLLVVYAISVADAYRTAKRNMKVGSPDDKQE